METKICSKCAHCCMGMRGGVVVYSCMKIRGGKNDGFEYEDERMKISKNRKACTFFNPEK